MTAKAEGASSLSQLVGHPVVPSPGPNDPSRRFPGALKPHHPPACSGAPADMRRPPTHVAASPAQPRSMTPRFTRRVNACQLQYRARTRASGRAISDRCFSCWPTAGATTSSTWPPTTEAAEKSRFTLKTTRLGGSTRYSHRWHAPKRASKTSGATREKPAAPTGGGLTQVHGTPARRYQGAAGVMRP